MEKLDMDQLNHEWRAFIEAHKLYILLNESEELLNFLASFRFFAPSKFPSYSDGILRQVSLEYKDENQSIQLVELAVFIKRHDFGEKDLSDWRVMKKNQLRIRVVDYGTGFQSYFDYLKIKRLDFAEELLKEFQLLDRLIGDN